MNKYSEEIEALNLEARARLEERLRGRPRKEKKEKTASRIPRRPGGGDAPSSFAQERLLFFDELTPGSPVYNVATVLSLEGPLDEDALAASFVDVLARHDALRTTFVRARGTARQVVSPGPNAVLRRIEMTRARLKDALREEAELPFDLEAGPLARALLLRISSDESVLALTVHHAVCDGWSIGVLARDLWATYFARLAGHAPALPELPIQYGDFATWQREWLSGEAHERQLSIWRARLAGPLKHLELPLDRERPKTPSYRGAHESFHFSLELTAKLKAVGRTEEASLHMALLAGLVALLSRYSGQKDLVVGSAVSGRHWPEVAELVGPFANTLPLRFDLSSDPSFLEILRRVRAVVLDAYGHQDVPLEKLVAEVAPERDPGANPLFPIVLGFQVAPRIDGEVRDLKMGRLDVETDRAHLEMAITLSETRAGLVGALEYATDLFDRTTIRRFLHHYQRLLEGAAFDPSLRLSSLPLLTETGRAELFAWSRAKGECPLDETLPAVFAERVAEAPDAWAVELGEKRLRYRELDRLSNGIAARLASRGIERGARVGILGPRSVELYAAALGVSKAGCAYVPLDPSYPKERLAFMIEDAALSAILTDRASADDLPGSDAALLYWDEEPREEQPADGRLPEGPRSSDELAYVMYTSGSTGVPKGVAVPHRSVLRLVSNTNYVDLRPPDRVAQAASFSFDAATFELWGGLLSGACVVGIEKSVSLDAVELGRELSEKAVTVLFLTTALFNEVAREAPDALCRLRVLLFGGELSDPASVRLLLERGGPERLLHVYGPTETTTFASFHELRSLPERARAVPIGAPIANTDLYVVDGSGELSPPGVEGELFIGGDGLARGYWNRPDRTAESFVPDPFGSMGGRLYRTGDRARWLESGALEFRGRADTQVKLRGHRIELGEVEAALRGLPGVRDAAAMVREDLPGDRRLVGYFVPDEKRLAAFDIRSALAEKLPEFMVPQEIEELEALPLTVNGKIDREALPAPTRRARTEAGSGDPRGPVEEAVAEIWKEILGVERAGVHDGFFDAGGHSLLAMRLLNRAREVFRVGLPLRGFFEEPTIAGLARMVEASRRVGALPEAPPLTKAHPEGTSGALPLSFAQQRLWLLDQIAGASPRYHVSAALSMEGELDEAALRLSLDEIVRRHEALRTSFRVVDEAPIQVVQEEAGLPLPLVDLTLLSGEAREELKRRLQDRARQLFDLSQAPLVRGLLVKLGRGEHVLQLTMHHIVADGWSVGIFFEELSALYEAFKAGQKGGSSPLEPLEIQYVDYAIWQRDWLEGEALQALTAHWKSRLQPFLAGSELPADRPRRASSRARGGRQVLVLPAALSRDLEELSRSEGVTLFMLLLAGFQSLLHLWTGSERVVVGTPIANRGASETEKLIGFFANTLALAVDLSGRPSFRDAIARVREATLDAYSHQDVPFEKIVEALSPDRDWGKNPLFQITFALQTAPFPPPRLQGLALSGVESSAGATRFDLEMHLWSGREGIRAVANYDRDLFDPETIARLLESYRTLLEGALLSPDRTIDELPLLSPSERRWLHGLNDTRTEYPRATTLPDVFADRVKEHPERVAVAFGRETLTYRELDSRAESLARRLAALGVGPECLVGVLGERSVSLYVAVLAVAKAGGAYVPLDPSYPRERLRFMIEDSRLTALLVDEKARELLPATDVPVVDWRENGVGPLYSALSPRLMAENLAYVMYTSGSTGAPKGVGITHRAVLRLVFNSKGVELGEDDRIAQVANFSFDAATFELWGALLRGGRLVGFEKSLALEPRAFGRELEEQGVTAMFLTTSLFKVMAREANESLRGVRSLLVGGEAVDADTARSSLEGGGPPRLVNGYGPTESTTFAAFGEVRRVGEGLRTIPIGLPLDNTELHVVSEGFELSPVGVPGELFIGGEGLARGYWRRPELTSERFVPNPWGPPGSRLYRTGDRVKRLAGGEIEYLGRFDSQVKLRGYRIELGEVETTLRREAQVKDAAVVVRPDASGEARLVGYVVSAEGKAVSEAELRGALSQKLPDYMVPQAIVLLGAMPLTPNGKVDKESLPEPGRSLGEPGALPRGPVEEGLAEIWKDLLGLECFGIHDDFFRLGGHSLAATRLVSRVRSAFRVELSLRHFFEGPTIAKMAARIAASSGVSVEGPVLGPRSRSAADVDLPLSFAQQRLWFLAELDPTSTAYNMPSAYRLEGPLDVEALASSLAEVRRRHEALRTVFASVGGRAVARVVPPDALGSELSVVDLGSLDGSARKSEARRLTALEAATLFDLASGPLLRARVVRLGPAEHLFLLTLHHIVSDGWSQGILFREIETLYLARLEKRKPALEELPLQYADYAAWERERLSGPLLEEELSYWRSQLEDLTVLNLPTDRPRPPIQTFRGGRQSLPLRGLREGASELARHEGVTLFMLLLAAFQTLLHRYAGQDDIVVGTPVANRTRQEIEGLIGFFANNLVLRVDFSEQPSFREILSRVRRVAVEAYHHQEIPFEKLVDELAPERSLSRSPLFQVVFAVHGGQTGRAGQTGQTGQTGMSGGLSLEGVKPKPQEAGIRTTRFDLELYLWDQERAQDMTAVSFYNADLFEAETVARMLRHFQNLLSSALSNPDAPVSELSLLSPEERGRLLHEWSGREVAPPEPLAAAALHRAFEARVTADADRVALTSPTEGSLTYGDLDRRANQLAHRLVDLGVGAESLVALCLERSFDLVVAILAVLKAGGAYVPLDPGYPEDRLSTMLEDSGVDVLLTESGETAKLSGHEGKMVVVDRERERIESLAPTPPAVASEPSQLAYVIYTSGSTGRPKGVGVTHENVLRLFSATAPWYQFDERDVFTLFHSYAFDFSVWELWGALLNGGRLVIVPYWVSRDPEAFYELLAREKVTILNQTPSAFRALVHAEELSGTSGLALRRVVFGGEALELRSLEPWTRRHEEERPLLVNMYGITETTVHVTYREIRREDVLGSPGSVIGRPIPDLSLFLLDENLEPVPQGVRGELYVAGKGLARGYLGRPDLTAERFVPHPHGEPGSRLYRTGDLGRYRANGDVEYLGRIDHQVKVRGFRIELGEIEAALAQNPSVREAVVRLREEESDQKRLVAYVVPSEAASAAVLRSHLAERLPEYMVPSAFVFLERLPLTSQGKLDARRLPVPETPLAGSATEVERPETPAEKILIDVWKGVLRLSAVGIRDNFFELGGDSILSIQVVARAKERGLLLTARDLFQNQTIETLARAVRRAEGADTSREEPVEGDSPLLPVQRWFFEREPEEAYHYNQSMLFSLPKGFRAELLASVLEVLHARHDALRLRFDRVSGEMRAAHDPGAKVTVSSVDLRGLSLVERTAAIESISSKTQASLHLSRGPLACFVHFDAGPDESGRLLAVIHHLVVDGVSWRILLEEFERVYRSLSAGTEVVLAPKTTSYRRFSTLLSEHALSESVESQAGFWRETLSRGGALGFPLERAPADVSNIEGDVARVRGILSEEETRALLQDLPARYRTEVNDALLAGLLDAVSRLSGQNVLTLTLEGHGREELFDSVDVSRTVGWFTSLYPVSLSRKEGESPAETLRSVKEQLRRIPEKGIGYGLLRYSNPRFAPEFQALESRKRPLVSFNYLGQLDGTLAGDSFFQSAPDRIGRPRSPRGERRHLIDVTAVTTRGRLQVEWMYAGKVFERRSIETLNEAFLDALRSLLQSGDEPEMDAYSPSDFPLLDLDQAKLEKLLSRRLPKRD